MQPTDLGSDLRPALQKGSMVVTVDRPCSWEDTATTVVLVHGYNVSTKLLFKHLCCLCFYIIAALVLGQGGFFFSGDS